MQQEGETALLALAGTDFQRRQKRPETAIEQELFELKFELALRVIGGLTHESAVGFPSEAPGLLLPNRLKSRQNKLLDPTLRNLLLGDRLNRIRSRDQTHLPGIFGLDESGINTAVFQCESCVGARRA